MRLLATLLTSLLVTATALAQTPQIDYIFPDIGAPGMNTYVEIIGPAYTITNFSNTDKLFDKDDPSLRVETTNAADTQFIVIGPYVTSWYGKMVSTQIFVKPNTPPGTYNIRVVRNGVPSNSVPFYVIIPAPLTMTGGGTIGATGTIRSRRGAMVVSSLTLGIGTYTVDPTDRDVLLNGEQGLLPLVLISKGPISIASGATIQLDGSGRNGAPGGGGGGGQVCDATFSGGGSTGGPGGYGFTGGTGGGRNGLNIYPNVTQNDGWGSGPTRPNALNGAEGGRDMGAAPESGGGGTGHPFGRGGRETSSTTRAEAGWGGAGGAGQNSAGAGGGYGAAGAWAGGTGGQVHGNQQGVPVAGGSGGSSGNPQSPGACGGEGGGGGGAIAIFSQTSLNNSGTITARGANGGSGSSGPNGGGGSGGMVIVGAKDSNSTGGLLNTSGGQAGGQPSGGNGRTRYDGFMSVRNPNIIPTSQGYSTEYIGPTIDTLTYVRRRTFTIYGTQDPQADVRIWVKGDNAFRTWTNVTSATPVTRNGRRWSFNLTIPAGGYYYIAAAQFKPTPTPDDYNREPIWVMSQVAANIVYADINPEINGDTVRYFGTVGCQKEIIDTIRIWNTGDEDLVVQAPTPNPAGPFTVLSPTFPQTIARDDTIAVVIRYRPTTPGVHSEFITFPNNDPRVIQGEPRPRAQWQVRLQGRMLRIEPSLSTRRLVFATECVDSTLEQSLNYQFQGDTISYIRRIDRLGTGTQVFRITSPLSFPTPPITNGNGTTPITVSMRATAPGTYRDSFRVVVSPCDSALVFVVEGTVVALNATITPNPVDFGPVRTNTTAGLAVTVENTGTATFRIGNVWWEPPLTTLRVPVDPAGRVLAPGATTSFDVEFRPIFAGPVSSRLKIELLGVCNDTIEVEVTGTGITSLLVLSRRVIELRADSCAAEPGEVIDTFRLTNRGLAPESVTSAIAVNGLVTLTTSPPVPPTVSLAPDEFMVFTVRWTPGTIGTQTEIIRILTTSADPAQRLMEVELRLVWEVSRIALFEGNDTLRSIDFGTTFQCDSTAERPIELRSLGTLTEIVNARFAVGSGFEIAPAPDYTVARGGSVPLTVRFNPSVNGQYLDTLIVRSLNCPAEIRIPLTGAYVGLSYNAGGVNFNQSNVGVTVTGDAFLSYVATPLNSTKTVVESAYIRPPGAPGFAITRSNLPDTLAPGEMTTVEVGFTPTAEQAYSAELCFVLSEPCRDTICVPLTGEGIQANLLVRQTTLNFGPKFACQDTTLDLVIENTGQAPVNIQDIRISGPDAAAFERVTPFTPGPLGPRTSATYTFRFVPARSSGDGMKTAVIEIISDDPNRPTLQVTMIGERRGQALATPASLDFGSVVIGTSSELDLVIESRTPVPLRISAFRLLPPFQVVSPTAPLVIPAFGSVTVRVRFTPVSPDPVAAVLIVEHSEPCLDSTLIPLSGSGREIQVARIQLEVPDGLRGAPGDRLSIPIVMTQAQLVAESEATTFVARIRFDRELLWPEDARAKGQPLARAAAPTAGTGRIVSSTLDGNDRIVTVEIANQPMPTGADTLGYLDATAMLSDHVTTPIVIDTVYFTDGPVIAATENGDFTLVGYCEVDSNRFIRISGAAGLKSVAPNPFNTSVEIIFETSEDGATSLRLRSADGRSVATIVDGEALSPGAHRRVFVGEHLASGVYLLELVTPTERHVQRIILVR